MAIQQDPLDKLPSLEKFHASLAHFKNNAQLLVNLAAKYLLPLPPEYEAVVASYPKWSLQYAEDVLKGPFPAGEAAMATDLRIGFDYATRVLKGPFPALEPLLYGIGEPYALVSYAIDAAKTRLTPLAESKILDEPFQACFYARDILKGRWEPLEARLLTSSKVDCCLRYVQEVIGGPWPEAEPLFFSMNRQKPLYLSEALEYATFVQKPLPEPLHAHLMHYDDGTLVNFYTRVLRYAVAVKTVIPNFEENSHYAFVMDEALHYIEQVSHGRWDHFEPVCARNMEDALRYAKATGAPFDLGAPAIFAKKSGPVRYFNILKKMPDSPERDLWMLLASGYARHKDAQKVFQSKGLDYHTVWPLWEGLGLGLDERKELLQSLLAPKVDTVGFDDIEMEPSMLEGTHMKHARIRSKEDALLWLWGPDADNPVMPEEGYSPSLVHAVLPYFTEPLEWLHIARGTGVVLPPDYEKVLATNGEWAFSYAQEVLQGPFPEAHAILATDLDEGLVYAQHILESRWPEFEAMLLGQGSPEQLAIYASDCIKGPFPEAHAQIIQDADAAFYYARNALNARWIEAESVIMVDPDAGLKYAMLVRESRWPEFEATLFQMDDDGRPTYLPQALTYALHFGCRLPEPMHSHLEEHIRVFRRPYLNKLVDLVEYALAHHMQYQGLEFNTLVDPQKALNYVTEISKRPWPSMELLFIRHVKWGSYLQAIQQPFSDIAEDAVFDNRAFARFYYNELAAMEPSPERNLSLLLAAGYARKKKAPECFHAQGLNYDALWPLWDSLNLASVERKALLRELLAPALSVESGSIPYTSLLSVHESNV